MANAWFMFVLALSAALLLGVYVVAHTTVKRAEKRQSTEPATRITPEEVRAAGSGPFDRLIDVNTGQRVSEDA